MLITPTPSLPPVIDPLNFRTAGAFLTIPSNQLKKTFVLHFYMKTPQPNGLILFAAGPRDFIAVELKNGQLRYVFNATGVPQGRPQVLRVHSQTSLADNEWHLVQIFHPTRDQHSIRVGDMVRDSKVHQSAEWFNLTSLLYVGGLPGDMYSRLPQRVRARRGFQGCLGEFQINEPTGNSLLSVSEIADEYRHDISNVCQGLYLFLFHLTIQQLHTSC